MLQGSQDHFLRWITRAVLLNLEFVTEEIKHEEIEYQGKGDNDFGV